MLVDFYEYHPDSHEAMYETLWNMAVTAMDPVDLCVIIFDVAVSLS